MKIFRCDSCSNRGLDRKSNKSCVIIVDENSFTNPHDYEPMACPYYMEDEPEWREVIC